MAKSIRDIAKKRRGRPKTTGLGTGILVRMHEQLNALDGWIAKQREPGLTRPEAIRRLVELGLSGTAKPPSGRPSEKSAAKAKKLAAETIDGLADNAAPAEEQASRKRHLLKGPEEFQTVRVDRAKPKGK